MIENWPALLVFIAVNCAAAATGGIFRPGRWYETLRKPSWTPPNWLFGPAWSLLYAANAFAGYLVWQYGGPGDITVAMAFYALQLILNGCWSAIFFGMRRPDLAFGELIFLWLAILGTILTFWPLRTDAALLLLPYLAWVTFAGALNFAVWQLNAPQRRSA
ncbi:TspO/MBR family protein [Acuticoccus kandeliae]|uniref:TspO/MBR family protein n=1 Tax=Acuticoccus kandeliae TaxID=2073160 RepID=UPI000D3E75A2|nr:TspO/MBR family protein [Acuticoccus kandeliae]